MLLMTAEIDFYFEQSTRLLMIPFSMTANCSSLKNALDKHFTWYQNFDKFQEPWRILPNQV